MQIVNVAKLSVEGRQLYLFVQEAMFTMAGPHGYQ